MKCAKCGNSEKSELVRVRSGYTVMVDRGFKCVEGALIAGEIAIMPPQYECNAHHRFACNGRRGVFGVAHKIIVEKLRDEVKEKRRYTKCK